MIVGMLDCQATLLEGAIPDYVLNGVVPKPLGSRHPSIAPFQAFNTKDKPIVIAAGDDHLFQLMAVAISAPDIAQNPIFAPNELRLEHICELQAEMEKVLVNRPSAEWLNLLDAAGVPCGPLNTVKELVANDQIAARNMIVKTIDPEVGQIMIAGNPVKISGVDDPSSVPPPPRLDEHRAEILKMLNNKDLPA